MLLRESWRAPDEESWALMEARPWALLLVNGPAVPLATALPILLDRTRGRLGTLVGHIGRANPQARSLTDGTHAMALFQGDSAYVTPSWYPARDMAPTIYYAAVEAEGVLRLQDAALLRRWLERLTQRFEAERPDGWSIGELPERGIGRRIEAILGFDLEITALRGKLKFGQDEPKRDALAVAERLAASDQASDRAVAAAVRRRNRSRP